MTRRVSRRGKGPLLTGFGRNVRDQARLDSDFTASGRVIATVEDQMALFVLPRSRNRNNNCLEHISELDAVVPIGPAQHYGQGNAFGIGQERSFAARFASVGGVAAGRLRRAGGPLFPSGALTMLPSAACHSHSMPSSRPYSWRSTAHAR